MTTSSASSTKSERLAPPGIIREGLVPHEERRMKRFVRNDPLFSLCGLNCGLCPMKLGGHCSGCGIEGRSCKIARCSLEHGGVEYCFQCVEYPCERCGDSDDLDSFITYRNRRSDMEKARRDGIGAYDREQVEKVELLDTLLTHYDDGRRKTLYCVSVNLLKVDEIKEILGAVEADLGSGDASVGEKAAYVAQRLRELGAQKDIQLRLRKKRSVKVR